MFLEMASSDYHDPIIAVGIGKSKSSMYALRWTIEKLIAPGGTLHLIHVFTPLRFIPTPMGGNLPIHQVNGEIVANFKQEQLNEINEFMEQYKTYCERKQVQPLICLLENDNVTKALLDYISDLAISKLVLGTGSRSMLKMTFSGPPKSEYVAKNSPEFCTVLIVHKYKLISVRDASQSPSPRSSTSTFTRSSTDSGTSDANWNGGKEHKTGGFLQDAREPSSKSMSSVFSMERRNPHNSMSGGDMTMSHESARGSPYPLLIHCSSRLSSLNQTRDNADPRLSTGTSDGQRYSSSSSHFDDPSDFISIAPGTPRGDLCRSRSRVDETGMLLLEPCHYEVNLSATKLTDDDMHAFSSEANSQGIASFNNNDDIDACFDARNLESMKEDPFVTIAQDMEYPCKVEEDKPSLKENHNEVENDGSTMVSEIVTLKQELHIALKTMEKQSIRLKKAEEALTNAMHMVKEYNTQRQEAVDMKESSLSKMETERKKREEMEAVLGEALTELEMVKRTATREKSQYEEAFASLQKTSRERDMFQKQAAEALDEVEEMRRALEKETQLRKRAEAKVLQGAMSKRETALAQLTKKAMPCKYSEYSLEELHKATCSFSEEFKLGEGGYGCVFKGLLHGTAVAIKVTREDILHEQPKFQREVQVLSRIHHPHLVTPIGACQEKACIVSEYMDNGSLEQCLTRTPPLPWYMRIQICYQAALALMYLHNSRPEPIIHGGLNPGNILLNRNLVCKISDAGRGRWIPNDVAFNSISTPMDSNSSNGGVGRLAYIDPDYQRTGYLGPHSDVYSLGIIILQALTGKRQPVGVTDVVEDALDSEVLSSVLDSSAGTWPIKEAAEFASLGLRCAEPKRRQRLDLARVLPLLKEAQKVAEAEVINEAIAKSSIFGNEAITPSSFICPLSQEVMEDPYIAADDFTYEYKNIEAWLYNHETSPMTNMPLTHKNLTPNHTLKSIIHSWQSNRSGTNN